MHVAISIDVATLDPQYAETPSPMPCFALLPSEGENPVVIVRGSFDELRAFGYRLIDAVDTQLVAEAREVGHALTAAIASGYQAAEERAS